MHLLIKSIGSFVFKSISIEGIIMFILESPRTPIRIYASLV